MKKITAKFINENLDAMLCGAHINHRGAEYWVGSNNVIYYISANRKMSGCINGCEYGMVSGGVAYKA